MVRVGLQMLALAAVASGCARAEPPAPPPPELPPEPPVRTFNNGAREGSEPRDLASLELRRVHFEEGAMAVDLVHEAEYSTHAWDVGGVLTQVVPLTDSPDDVLRILIRAGEGESLAGFRRDHDDPDAAYSALVKGKVCGRPSKRVEVSKPELYIECIEYADGRPSEPGYDPAITIIAQAFDYGDLGVVATWELPTELRERYRTEEERFFASFRCGAGALGERMAGAQ